MSGTPNKSVALRYQSAYLLGRLRGKGVDEASTSARFAAMRKMSKMIDARTQSLARNICTDK